jgi:hypothetical protein
MQLAASTCTDGGELAGDHRHRCRSMLLAGRLLLLLLRARALLHAAIVGRGQQIGRAFPSSSDPIQQGRHR